LQDKFDIFYILIASGASGLAKELAGNNKKFLYCAVKALASSKMVKEAEKIIKANGFDITDFPEVQKKKIKRTLAFLLNSNSLILHLIELAKNDEIAMPILVKLLIKQSYTHKWMVKIASYLIKAYKDVCNNILCNSIQNFEFYPALDEFKPYNPSFYHLPGTVNVIVIDDLQGVQKLAWGQETVASLDSEWKVALELSEVPNVSILQIGFSKCVYIIDLLQCNQFEELDDKLYELLQDPDVVKLGISFDTDMKYLKQSYPYMLCFQQPICNYIDLIKTFVTSFDFYPGGLAGLTEFILNQNLDKNEQKSNWENRPLRKAQLHYAACDVYVGIQIYQALNTANNFSERFESINKNTKVCDNCRSRLHGTDKCLTIPSCTICGDYQHLPDACPCFVKI
jgi:ribonuclease D